MLLMYWILNINCSGRRKFEFLCGSNATDMYSCHLALNNDYIICCCDFSWIFSHSRVIQSSIMTLKRLVHYRHLICYFKIRPVTGVNKERIATAKSVQESSTGYSKHGANLECYKKQMFAWEVKSLLQKFVSLL